MLLSLRDLSAMRADSQAEDAAVRLDKIQTARTTALSAIGMALDALIEVVDAQRVDGNSIAEKDRRETLHAIDQFLADITLDAVVALEDAELGEGDHDLTAEAASDEGDRRYDEWRDRQMEGGA